MRWQNEGDGFRQVSLTGIWWQVTFRLKSGSWSYWAGLRLTMRRKIPIAFVEVTSNEKSKSREYI